MTLRRRDLLLDELERLHIEGALDDDAYRALRDRYLTSTDARLDERFAPATLDASGRAIPAHGAGEESSSSFAATALQFTGGLLLGAALVALAVFLRLDGERAAWSLLAMGAAALGTAFGLHALAPTRSGLVEALLAAGLVAIAATAGFFEDAELVPWLAAALAAGTFAARRGHGPSVLVAGIAFTVTTAAALLPALFSGHEGSPYTWWLLLAAFGALMLVWRREAWTSATLGLYVAPLTLAIMPILDAWNIHDSTVQQLLIGGYLGALLALGILLRIRGLVGGAAAGLTIDAVVFAADVGGAGTAVVVLLALGGVLVWQAEFLRGYFGRRRA